MLASRFVGTSDTSTSSMCARQALSEVSLRSSTEAKVLPPFTCYSLRIPYRWWGEDTRCGESVGHLAYTAVSGRELTRSYDSCHLKLTTRLTTERKRPSINLQVYGWSFPLGSEA